MRKSIFSILVLFMVISFLITGCTALCPSPIPISYTIIATSGTGGYIEPEREIILFEGDSQVFTINPHEGYEIDDILIDGTSVGAVSTYTFTEIQQDHTIEASFVQVTQPATPVTTPSPTPKYTITATSGKGGSIDPEGAIKIDKGKSQVFTIAPDESFLIDDVLVDGQSVGAVGEYTFTDVQQNHTIEASFVTTYTITATYGTGGSIDPEGEIGLVEGTNQVFNIIPDEGFEIDNVLVDGQSVGAVGEYTFENILQDHTIEARFIRAEPLFVNWTFEDEEKRNSVIATGNIGVYTPDEGNGIIELIGASMYDFTLGSGGTGSNAATAILWPMGSAGNKYWLITISTTGYQNIEISSKQRSSNTGPRDFKVQYSTDKTTWLDIDSTAITVANNFTSGVIDEVQLPTECDNQETLYLRWIMTSEISVNEGEVGPTGTNRIDDILVSGDIVENI